MKTGVRWWGATGRRAADVEGRGHGRIGNPSYVVLRLPLIVCVMCLQVSIAAADDKIPRIAVITTVWYHNSHADVIAGRLLEGMTLEGRDFPQLKLASLYVDQFPDNDKSRTLAAKHGVPLFDTVAKALTLGGDTLAVDGVMVIGEHGKYPESDTGQFLYPKRRFLTEVFRVFETSGRVVPVFSDKHLSDNWADVDWIWSEAKRLKVPMMAGSSLPGLWRQPAADVDQEQPLREIVATSYHRLDSYGFHGLEVVQCLAEQRRGGETGVRSVRCIEGPAVWEAGQRGVYDRKLLNEAVSRLRQRRLEEGQQLEDVIKKPILFVIDYRDGLRASILTLDGLFSDWTAAWKYADGRTASTHFAIQEVRPFQHFGLQLQGIQRMMQTGQPAWPVERTVLTSGVLDAALISRRDQNRLVETPYLNIEYRSPWKWSQPPPPPNGRPLNVQ